MTQCWRAKGMDGLDRLVAGASTCRLRVLVVCVLVGGSGRTVALQPLSVEGSVGHDGRLNSEH
jgi:hypothetical protein